MNKAIIIGNLTRNPEERKLDSGTMLCTFSLATNRKWKNSEGEKQEEVEYHNCVAFGKTAEIISEYCQKGKKLMVEGRLKTNSWEDEDGKKRYKTDIIVENFEFLSSKGDRQAEYAKKEIEKEQEEETTGEIKEDGTLEIRSVQEKAEEGKEDVKVEDLPF